MVCAGILSKTGEAQTWQSMAGGMNHVGGGVNALAYYKGELYAGGGFDSAGGQRIYNLAKWNGTSWSQVGLGFSKNANVFALTVDSVNNLLYIGGGFDSVGGIAALDVASWDGTSFHALGSGIGGTGVSALLAHNGTLYAAGNFDTAGGIYARYVASWNGTAWDSICNTGILGHDYADPSFQALGYYKGQLYIGGDLEVLYNHTTRSYCVGYFNGTNWYGMTNGCWNAPNTGGVCAFINFKGLLYVGGNFWKIDNALRPTTANGAATWNGTAWAVLDQDYTISTINPGAVYAFATDGLNLYTAGYYNQVGGWYYFSNICATDTDQWLRPNTMDSGLFGGGNYVSALCLTPTDLYAGGGFRGGNHIKLNLVADYNGVTTVINSPAKSSGVNAYPNPGNGLFELGIGPAILREGMNYNIEIYNVLGERVYSKSLPAGLRDSFLIDLRSNSNGIYFYRVVTDAGNVLGGGKLVIQK